MKSGGRSKSGSATKRSRQRPNEARGSAGTGSIIRLGLVIFLAGTVFLVGFICDTGALARLFWAALGGQVGLLARLGAFAVLLVLASVVILGFIHPARLPPRESRRTAARSVRNEEQNPRARAVDNEPAATRSRRKKPGAALNQPS